MVLNVLYSAIRKIELNIIIYTLHSAQHLIRSRIISRLMLSNIVGLIISKKKAKQGGSTKLLLLHLFRQLKKLVENRCSRWREHAEQGVNESHFRVVKNENSFFFGRKVLTLEVLLYFSSNTVSF